MTNRAVVFYVSSNAAVDRTPVYVSGVGSVFVRGEVAASFHNALDSAKPRHDEHVMNSHTFKLAEAVK